MTSSTDPETVSIFAWPIDHPWWTIAVLAAIIGFIGLALPKAHVDFSLEQLYPQNSELAQTYKEHKDAYGADDNSFFAVREGSAWAPQIKHAEEKFRSLVQVDKTISPFTMERLVDREGVLEMQALQSGDADVLTRGTVLSMDDSAGAIIVRVAEPHNNHNGRDALLTEVERIIEDIGGEWHLAGMPVIRTAYVRLVLTDLRVLIPLSIFIAGFFFILSFRDTRQVVVGLVSISLGMLASAAAYVMAGGVVNTFSPAFFSVVVVVGTSDLIHLVHRFSDHVDEMGTETQNIREAARRSAREIGFACLLTTTTTAIGFLALVWTDLPTVQMFGMGAGAGVMITYIITFLVVPPCLARLRPPSRAAQTHAVDGGTRMRTLGRWVLARRRTMVGIFAVVAVMLTMLGSQTEVAYRLLADLGSTDAGTSQQFMEEHMGAVLPMSVDIRFEGDARSPEALAAIDSLTRWVREQPLVGQTTGLADLTRSSWETLSGQPGTMPPTREAAAQSLFMLSMAEDDPVPSIMLDDGKRTRILMRVKDEGGAATIALTEKLEAKAKEILAPVGGQASVTGVAYVVQWINRTLTQQFVGSFGIALLLIGTAWMVTTRSIRRVAVALIPNILPLLAVLAALGATGIPLKPTTAMVFSIGLGIAVDDTIHFLAAYERWRKQNPGCQAEEAVEHAYATAGRSMLDTSIVLTAGMMAMAASEFNGFLYLGGFTAWSVVAALVTDLLLLGPLLVILEDR